MLNTGRAFCVPGIQNAFLRAYREGSMDTLDEAEIDEVLRNTGYGFLGLARNNRPYVIPTSFGYDGMQFTSR